MSTDHSPSEMSLFECSSEEKEIDQGMSTHIDLSDNTDRNMEPYIGLEFNDLDLVYNFYTSYGKKLGFGIRKNSSIRCRVTNELQWKNYVCDKAGLKSIAKDESESQKRRRETRTGCKAKLGVRKNKSGIWVINSFIKEHNHMLDTHRRTRKHQSHHVSHKNKDVKVAIDQLSIVDIRPCNITKMLDVTEISNASSSKNVIDHLGVKRRNHIGREGLIVAQYLQTQQLNDPNFFFALELDTNGFLRSLFWADSRARKDYVIFSDVIIFDITYKTNKFAMTFVPFTGVNHHRQSILFGCALLTDETEESFIWIFQQWLRCMFDRQPKTIITDMNLAIYNAIKIVFPTASHRFCSWHIDKHLVENFSEMRDPKSEFSKDYWNWYYSRTTSLSETTWRLLLDKYELQNNNWLLKMWDRRKHWVPAFLQGVFVGGMTSTGKCESMNAFFDGFVNLSTHLDEFVMQYENALKARRLSEEIEDFKTMNSVAALVSKTTFEAHAGQCYTKSMFELFQNEFKQGLECWHEKPKIDGKVKTYLVGISIEGRDKWFNVVYDEENPTNFICDCGKFESDGFVCKHIIHIMFKKHMLTLPEKYILKRWTINARYISDYEASVTEISKCGVTPIMKWTLKTMCNKLVEKISTSQMEFKSFYEIVKHRLNACDAENNENLVDNVNSQIDSNILSVNIPSVSIGDPTVIRRKGRPRIVSRVESDIELSQANSKKRTCGFCGDKGHYTTTCSRKSKEKIVE